MGKQLGEFSIWSCPDFQAPWIGRKLQVESSCLSASKLAFWVLGRDSVWKLLLLRTYAKQRQEIPKVPLRLGPNSWQPSIYKNTINIQRNNQAELILACFTMFQKVVARHCLSRHLCSSWLGQAEYKILGGIFLELLFMDWNRNSSRFVQQCVGMGFQRCRQGIRTCCIETVLTKQSCPNPKQMLHGLL